MTGTPRGLTRNTLGPAGIVFLVLAAVAPLTAMVVIAPLGIALGSGGGIPGSFVFAAVVLLLFAVGYVRMNRHVVNAGAFYAYVTRAMGRIPGLVTAFIALLGYNTFVIGAVATSGYFTAQVFDSLFQLNMPWEVWSAVSVALVFALGRRGIDVSATILGVSLLLESAILLVLDISVLVQDGFQLHAFAPTVVFGSGAGLGMLFAFNAFLGFEATALFGEEARTPRRTIPRATYTAITLIGVFYVITTWAMVSAVGVSNASGVAAQDPGNFLFGLAHRYLGGVLTGVLQLLLVVSLFAALLALHNSATRYLFALGRAHVLPAMLGRTHRRSGAPHVASSTQMGLSAAVIAIFALAGADPMNVIVPSMTGFGTLGIIALQASAAIAVVVFFRRRHDPRLITTLLAPGLGGIGMLLGLGMAIAHFDAVAGTDSPVITQLPWLLLATVPAAIVIGLRMRSRRPGTYDQLGRDFAGEEPDEGPRGSTAVGIDHHPPTR